LVKSSLEDRTPSTTRIVFYGKTFSSKRGKKPTPLGRVPRWGPIKIFSGVPKDTPPRTPPEGGKKKNKKSQSPEKKPPCARKKKKTQGSSLNLEKEEEKKETAGREHLSRPRKKKKKMRLTKETTQKRKENRWDQGGGLGGKRCAEKEFPLPDDKGGKAYHKVEGDKVSCLWAQRGG